MKVIDVAFIMTGIFSLFLIYFASVITFALYKSSKFAKSIAVGNTLRSLSDFPELEETFDVVKIGKNSFLVKSLKTEKLSEISLDKIHLYELDK